MSKHMANDLSPAEWHRTLTDHMEEPDVVAGNDSDGTSASPHQETGKSGKKEMKKKLVLIDTRNWYESEVGKFTGAVPLGIDRYSEAFQALDSLLLREDVSPADTKVMMYCTGGIRCVKLGTYVKEKLGFEDVNQLRGGIIGYVNFIRSKGVQKTARELVDLFSADKTLSWLPGRGDSSPGAPIQKGSGLPAGPPPVSQFIGKNFVFDERKGERVTEDVISKCHQCGSSSDLHRNCANPVCNILFIQCPTCHAHHHGACSTECLSVVQMDKADQEIYVKKYAQLKRLQNPSAFNKNIHVVQAKVRPLGATSPPLPATNGSPPRPAKSVTIPSRAYSSALETPGIQEYCDKYSTPVVPLLRTLAAETRDSFPSAAHMMISSSQSMLFTMLASIIKAKNILEIGCFTGFSAISLAQSLPAGGRLLTLEVDERVAEVARRYISKSNDLQERVRIQIGPGLETLNGLSGQEPFDLVFIDADKNSYLTYYNTLLDRGLVRHGGLILVDNVLSKGKVVLEDLRDAGQAEDTRQTRDERRAKVMHEFNQKILSDPRTRKVIMPIRDGLTIMEVL